MALQPGTRLGPYEIEASAGAGGMGEVYRARDTRLERIVAVKVLPADRSADADARARLEREAKSISSLSHPHICALYDIGHEGGIDFLVMEYLEGTTLASRIETGPMPVPEALKIAGQVVNALAAAHKQGFVHRDLKPGNVMLTKSGAKLLDFGLAKAFDDGLGPAGGLTAVATATTPLTAAGTILGTFQYMAPEQLEGKPADARSDLFAFGAVLYEMLTGVRAFVGATQASLVAGILKEEPRPLSALAPTAPAALERVVQRCLAKDPDERWHSASDLGHELRAIADGTSVGSITSAGAAAATPVARRGGSRLAWTVAALFAVATLALGLRALTDGPAEPAGPVALEVFAPNGELLRMTGSFAAPVAVSPDGTKVVFGALERDGRHGLWVRSLDSTEAVQLPNTEDGERPFWSPDGRSVAFFAGGELRRVDLSGGPAMPICAAPFARGGSWSPSGVIVFSPNAGSPLSRVSADGGTPEPATEFAPDSGHASHRYPHFLPDGETFLFLVISSVGVSGTGAESENEVWAGSLAGDEPRWILRGAANAEYMNGELLFVRGHALMAQPFDPERLELSGDVRVIVPDLQYDAPFERGIFSASPRLLAFRSGAFSGESELSWFRPDGIADGDLDPRAIYTAPELSPDGNRLAFSMAADSGMDIWVQDLATSRRTRLTFDPDGDTRPRWSPDGRVIAFARAEGEGWSLYLISADGKGTARRLLHYPDSTLFPADWTHDGRRLVFSTIGGSTQQVGVINVEDPGDPDWILQDDTQDLRWVRLSPDNRFLAYASDRTGRWEIYLTPFPAADSVWQISVGGGVEPVWSVDGRALYYRAGSGTLTKAEIDVRDDVPRVGEITPLFDALFNWTETAATTYDVAADGRAIITTMPEDEAHVPLTLVLDWR